MSNNTGLKGAAVLAPIAAGDRDRPAAFSVELAHHLPGRLRLRSAMLKGDARASEEACRRLARIDGITSARSNPTTGSILLEYDPDVISPGKISDLLAAHGYVFGATAAASEAGTGWSDQLASAAQGWVINALAERLALAMISALA